MSSWINFGVRVSEDADRDEVAEALRNRIPDLKEYGSGDVVKMTTFPAGRDRPSLSDIKTAIRRESDSIESAVIVDANDTSDTASGTAYDVPDRGGLEQTRSQYSGGESTRRDWRGLSYDGIRVSGGKY